MSNSTANWQRLRLLGEHESVLNAILNALEDLEVVQILRSHAPHYQQWQVDHLEARLRRLDRVKDDLMYVDIDDEEENPFA
jgi:hypothetical protein